MSGVFQACHLLPAHSAVQVFMLPTNDFPDQIEPPIVLLASDGDVVLHVPGFAVLRAAYEAEGYYDNAAGGDLEEQDLFRVEVLDAPRRPQAVEVMEGEPVGPLANLGLTEPGLWRLFPSARWSSDADALALVKQYLLVLAHALRQEERPGARQQLLSNSANWAAELTLDAFQSLPLEWRRIVLMEHG